ncbi:MAG TPA: TetR/AcrR family transcriptional regulator [Streptosporangiaceae bacterium]|nr:TetR/AcrR family transcriptional regulator [Streptosporangiaceae bacterium]
MSTGSPGDAAFEDLTARARIRNAALRYFTEYGFDRATIRDIARAAGVSPGLVRHHFGSKDELRKACDAYALESLHAYVEQAMTDDGLNDPKLVAEARDPLHPYQRYLARALIDASEAAAQIFDEMVAMTEQLLHRIDRQRPDPPVADLRTRAALMVAMALGIPAFQAHISRSIGTDILSPEGDRRVVMAVLDIQSHATISPETAGTLRQGLDAPAG